MDSLRFRLTGAALGVALPALGYAFTRLPLPGSWDALLVITVVPALGWRVYTLARRAERPHFTAYTETYLQAARQAGVWSAAQQETASRLTVLGERLTRLIPPEGPPRTRPANLAQRAELSVVPTEASRLRQAAQRHLEDLLFIQADLDQAAAGL